MYFTFQDGRIYDDETDERRDNLIIERFVSPVQKVLQEAAFHMQPAISQRKHCGVMLLIQPPYPGK